MSPVKSPSQVLGVLVAYPLCQPAVPHQVWEAEVQADGDLPFGDLATPLQAVAGAGTGTSVAVLPSSFPDSPWLHQQGSLESHGG